MTNTIPPVTVRDGRAYCGAYQWTLGNLRGTHVSYYRPEPREWWREHGMTELWPDHCYRQCRIPRRLRKAAKLAAEAR